jgi:hypothetical protein
MQKDSNLKHVIPFGWHIPSQRMVTVTEVANGRACECICAACGVRLQARQGAIRVWYFAHDEETNCQHAAEKAIHRMAKQMVAERGCVFVPHRQLSRTIHGKKRVWTEIITVDVQSAGLQMLADCTQEKTIGDSRSEGGSRRPDVFASLEGRPLAIEIRNTNAVDFDKQDWLERQGYSVLEIDIADIDQLPPDQIPEALEARLFQTSDQSVWLAHARDHVGEDTLDQLEAQIRAARKDEEDALLAKLDADEAERERKEEARRRYRDIEDFKVRLGRCTARVGRNEQRVSLKIHGYAPDSVFERIKLLGRNHHGHFNNKARCWEFYRHSENEAFFKQLCAEVQQGCLEHEFGTSVSPSTPQRLARLPTEAPIDRPWPIYFDDPAPQEAFDERAAILEFEAGFDREEAEKRGLTEITALLSGQVE